MPMAGINGAKNVPILMKTKNQITTRAKYNYELVTFIIN